MTGYGPLADRALQLLAIGSALIVLAFGGLMVGLWLIGKREGR